MIDSLLHIIAPHVCVACGHEGDLLCIDCGKKCISDTTGCFLCQLPLSSGELCDVCCKTYGLSGLTSVGWYKDELKSAVYAYKFGAKRGGATSLSKLLAQVANVQVQTLITYIPTTALHIRERGFDHAKQLAQAFASSKSLVCVATLARTNNHRQLGSNRSLRQATIAGTFVPTHVATFVGKDIIIIDDVMTTGSTMREAAKVLLRAGARSVHALVLAKTPYKTGPNR